MAPYHILIVIISSVIPENLVLLTKSEQSGPNSAHICPTKRQKLQITYYAHISVSQAPRVGVQRTYTVVNIKQLLPLQQLGY